ADGTADDELPVAGGGGGGLADVVAGAWLDTEGDGAGAGAACSAEQAASTGAARQATSHVFVVVGWGTAILPPRLAGPVILAHPGEAPRGDAPTGVPEITPAGWRPGPVAADTPSTMDD
ncbi:hypothetical protein, partial [Amycolatopsis sp. SID8362]|uniref:hypothetical protein n=1 Tax=Amycolatopsis sp. SID8362 TaxID=2690346 RepID=UPI00142C85B8